MKGRTQHGFTLIELLVVIAIIGVLASVVLASLNSAREKSRNASYAAQIKEYEKALALYYSDNGVYPGSSTWICVGYGYSGGNCWSSSNQWTDNSAAAVAFRTALAPYIDATVIPGPVNTTYEGAMYRTTYSGQRYDLYLIYEGDIDCPMGNKVTSSALASAGVTGCEYYDRH